MPERPGDGGDVNGNEFDHTRQRYNTSYHEEFVPLKGLPVEDALPLPRKRWWRNLTSIGASVVTIILCLLALVATILGVARPASGDIGNKEFITSPTAQEAGYATAKLFDESSRYIMRNYDALPPFSDFLPSVAGYYGKPLYAFWVNRGQGIASFGVKSKDYPIMEFDSANDAYQNVAILGFRTFIQGSRRGKSFVVEPFSVLNTRYHDLMDERLSSRLPQRILYVGANEMMVQETDLVNGIETNVTYFVLPEEDFGAFCRRTTIKNLQHTTLKMSVLDGLAKIQPAGGRLFALLKGMGRTLEGWKRVDSPYTDTLTMPFYKLSAQPSDTASVIIQEAGNWVLSVWERQPASELLPIVFDASKIFGEDTSLLTPTRLNSHSISSILREKQYGAAKTSCAFAALENITLAPGESLTISTFFGKAEHILEIPVIARRLLEPGFVQYKMLRSREIITQITAGIETKTANALFNSHVQQMFLDNSLRGGIPSIFGDINDDVRMRMADEDKSIKVYHLFSRIHGDLERDYNNISIESTFFSQGPGNFRDIIQNRRNDVIFNPRIGSTNVRHFLSFIQADGYNPLSVEAVAFSIQNLATCETIATIAVGEADGHRAQREALTNILSSGPFRPGQLFMLMEEQNIELILSRQDFIDIVAAAAETLPIAVYESGYWADHFTYYVDLIKSFLAIYPDWEHRIMYKTQLPYFFSEASVQPRKEKYVLSTTFDGRGKHVRQLDATIEDPARNEFLTKFIRNDTGWYDSAADWQKDMDLNVFKSTPVAKLFLLATLKFATRDPYGMGIEYEAGRPGWNDANNGLPGMIGSGMPETFELIVLLRYILSLVTRYDDSVEVPVELSVLVNVIEQSLDLWASTRINYKLLGLTVPRDLFRYWDTVSEAREEYRQKTKLTFCGEIRAYEAADLRAIIYRWLGELEAGIDRAIRFGANSEGASVSGLVPTYFSYTVTKWRPTGSVNKEGHPLVLPLEMTLNYLPLFLEGPTRMMKTVNSVQAREIYTSIKASPLRDEALKMYTISANLTEAPLDLGREMSFAQGWLENQSVWLHMQYKLFLELLRHNLYGEFFEELTSGAMLPFMDPQVYGRPLLQCSSFIASSAFEDPIVHGRGFLARLSGSTAEFLDMWIHMMIGVDPFFLDDSGGLRMQLLPVLPRWMFKDSPDKDPSLSFKLFGTIDVTYFHRKGNEDLFGVPPSRYIIGFNDGRSFAVEGPHIPSELADKIRRVVFVSNIDAYFD